MIHFQEVHGEVSINILRERKGNDESFKVLYLRIISHLNHIGI